MSITMDLLAPREPARLGTGNVRSAPCPVKDELRVEMFPTLILLDETGQIISRVEGLDERNLQALENEIKRRLVR